MLKKCLVKVLGLSKVVGHTSVNVTVNSGGAARAEARNSFASDNAGCDCVCLTATGHDQKRLKLH